MTKDVDTWVDEDAEHENELLHALMFGLLVASLTSGLQAAQLQISISLSTEQSNKIVQDYLKTQAAQHVAGINQTTRHRLRSALSEGLANRETNAELASRVSSVFTDTKGYRSQVIARTETAQAYSYSNEQALEATGVVSEYQWLTAEDERACPICGPLHGERRKAGQQYDGGLKPAFAHIECQCSEVRLVEAA